MKRTIFAVLTIIHTATPMSGVTTLAPDQPSTAYLDQEAQQVGFDRAWLLAVKDDPIIKKVEQDTLTATPEQARILWLKAANEQAKLGKANEIIYCLYRRGPFMQQWNTAPFRWAFFIDLGQRGQKRPSKTLPRNPISIAIAQKNVDLIETVMPKDATFVKQIALEPQTSVCQALMKLLLEAIDNEAIPVVSTLIERVKTYDLWNHEVVNSLKPRLIQAAGSNQEMLQILRNEGLQVPEQK